MNLNDQLRLDIACACRILAEEGMDDGLAGHISARIPGTEEFWVTPWGLYFDEMTPDDIVRIHATGKVLEGLHPVNFAVVIHLAIHEARPDAGAIVHTHPPHTTALSALGREIEPYDQLGCLIFEDQAVYPEFTGSVYTLEAARPIATALGSKRVAILKNHGLITVGPNLMTALGDTLLTERAARVQILATQAGARSADTIAADVARATKEVNIRSSVYEDLWRALVRRLHKSNPDLFAAENARGASLA
jgi:ribulose-5-phosphate 4-epimerase/fuculose-1-phosphate aldolase